MSQIRLRQVARLEKLARPYLERRTQYEARQREQICRHSFVTLANLSILILYGEPKIEEPLLAAWKRCLLSTEWQSRREKYGGFDEYGREELGTPFDLLGAPRIAEYFRKYFLPDFPGAEEIEKLNPVFEKAPPWLLWFTHGDVHARILGIKLPDLSGVNRFARGEMAFSELPRGPFECQPLPDGVYDRFEHKRHKDALENLVNMTPRERKRAVRADPRRC
jgi:hypothetical protein